MNVVDAAGTEVGELGDVVARPRLGPAGRHRLLRRAATTSSSPLAGTRSASWTSTASACCSACRSRPSSRPRCARTRSRWSTPCSTTRCWTCAAAPSCACRTSCSSRRRTTWWSPAWTPARPRWRGASASGSSRAACRAGAATSCPGSDVNLISLRLSRLNFVEAFAELTELHPADIADIVGQVGPRERAAVLAALNTGLAADTLQEMEEELRTAALQEMPLERAVAVLERDRGGRGGRHAERAARRRWPRSCSRSCPTSASRTCAGWPATPSTRPARS